MKKFHIAGPCIPHKHYMADISAKLEAILNMIDNGEYFIINRPRQYGKTTMLYSITREIQKRADFLVIPISFEGLGTDISNNERNFCQWFFRLIAQAMRFAEKRWLPLVENAIEKAIDFGFLSTAITDFVEQVDKKIVLLIDEVDRSSRYDVFLKFLAVLRDKYIKAENNRDFTFHNVILAGVHDIQHLKLQIRPDSERKLNSPWNIASEFKVNMSFQPIEITRMLEDYVAERKVQMNIPIIAQQLYDYTSGYPFLVSKICKVMDEQLLPEGQVKTWTQTKMVEAVQEIVNDKNFNFDSLIKNLEHHKDLYKMVFSMLIDGKRPSFSIQHPVTQLGLTYGIFKNGKGLHIHNPIYAQIIYNYMVFDMEIQLVKEDFGSTQQYVLPDRNLDVNKILLNFQKLMKEQYHERDKAFLERNGRLVFLAFLKPIINGKGHTFIEPQISDEKRLDIVVTFYEHKYIIELKLWYGAKAHDKGLKQLADYLDRQNQEKGWLLIFEHQRKKTWGKKSIKKHGKEMFAVWV